METEQKEQITNKARKDFPNSEIICYNRFLEIKIISYNINFDTPSWTHVSEISKDEHKDFYNITLTILFYNEDNVVDWILEHDFITFKVFCGYNKIGRDNSPVLISFEEHERKKLERQKRIEKKYGKKEKENGYDEYRKYNN